MGSVKVTVTPRQFVKISPEEAQDKLATIAFILKKYRNYWFPPLTPAEIPDTLEVNTTVSQEGEA